MMMLRDGCMVLRLVPLNIGSALLISSLKRYFPLARPLELGMKFCLLSNLNMSHFGDNE